MPHCRIHFEALRKSIEPTAERAAAAKTQQTNLRDWLQAHEFVTQKPHTRLIGSYQRKTAILDIKDVDILVFLPPEELERTPNSVLLELKKALEEYGDNVEAHGQRRSIRVDCLDADFRLDVVPAVAYEALEEPLEIPDRPAKKWIASDPLGYASKLTACNQENHQRVVPLIKIFKAWREANMVYRRPKSYLMEVLVLDAVEANAIDTEGSLEQAFASLLLHFEEEFGDYLQPGCEEVPEVRDPQLGTPLDWERSHFESFMRRIVDSRARADKAVGAETVDQAVEHWSTVFGELWPPEDEVKSLAREESARIQPGSAHIGTTGLVTGSIGIRSQPTRYYAAKRRHHFRPVNDPKLQISTVRNSFPSFRPRPDRMGGVVWKGSLSPAPGSPIYQIRIVHRRDRAPKVFVDSPQLAADAPHIYPSDGSLCLYWPPEWQWSARESLAETILPWTALWLYYYEIRLVTHEWEGPSAPHSPNKAKAA